MAINPDYDTAYEIFENYWEKGFSKKEAILKTDNYSPKTVKNHWREVWEKDDDGTYVKDSMEQVSQEFKDRVFPFIRSKIPQLVDEYLEIARTASSDAERRRAIEFLLETVGEFSKTEKVKMEIQSRFEDMAPEEYVEYLESLPGVTVDQREFMAGMFADAT